MPIRATSKDLMSKNHNLAYGGVWKFEAVGSVSGDGAPASFERADVTGF